MAWRCLVHDMPRLHRRKQTVRPREMAEPVQRIRELQPSGCYSGTLAGFGAPWTRVRRDFTENYLYF